jgi:hypothetical protein
MMKWLGWILCGVAVLMLVLTTKHAQREFDRAIASTTAALQELERCRTEADKIAKDNQMWINFLYD